MSRLRRAGSPWRILVHDYRGRTGGGLKYGKSHHVSNDPTFGRLPANIIGEQARKQLDQMRAEHSTETALPGTEFDELVIGRWIHLEQMDTGYWWMNIGGVTIQVRADRDGRPRHVTVYGPGDYAEPVPGVTYECAWTELREDT